LIDLSTALPTPKHSGRALRFAAPEASLFAVAMQTLQAGGEGAVTPMPGTQPIVGPALPTLGHERIKSPERKAIAAPDLTPPLLPVGRQPTAAGGKGLPDLVIADSDADVRTEPDAVVAEDEAPDELDALYAWFATAMAQPAPAPATMPSGEPVQAKRVIDAAPATPSIDPLVSTSTAPVEIPMVSPVGDAPVQVPFEQPSIGPAASAARDLPETIALPVAGAQAQRPAGHAGQQLPLPQDARPSAPQSIASDAAVETWGPSNPTPAPMATSPVSAPRVEPAPSRPAPTSPVPVPQAPAPAAAAILAETVVVAAAAVEPLAGLRRTGPREPAPIALALAEPPRPTGANPVAEVQHDAIDMRHQEWAGQMVERIEALREAAPAGETRIRLAPDLLGTVDVAIRQEGDRVNVHFTAETAAARQLLSDAQPRLAELAEARGVRLGQTSVDGGATGQNAQGQRHDAAPGQSARPARASASDDTLPSDDRIA
jgi:flagellar hook-length control protein FliK